MSLTFSWPLDTSTCVSKQSNYIGTNYGYVSLKTASSSPLVIYIIFVPSVAFFIDFYLHLNQSAIIYTCTLDPTISIYGAANTSLFLGALEIINITAILDGVRKNTEFDPTLEHPLSTHFR